MDSVVTEVNNVVRKQTDILLVAITVGTIQRLGPDGKHL